MTTTVTTTLVPTPAGALRVAVTGAGADERVVAIAFDDGFEDVAAKVRPRYPRPWLEGPSRAAAAISRYVEGDVRAIDELEVEAAGTPFQQRVWAALRTIPVGDTWSYQDLAAAIGQPGAVRAVGTANGANPICLVVPCHRVIRSDGSLGGYGGGIERKAWLLAHEGAAGLLAGGGAGVAS